MNFHINQEVVCIETHENKVVVEGNVYTILGLKQNQCSLCGDYVIVDVGVKSLYEHGQLLHCSAHNNIKYRSDGIWWLKATRFKPLDSIEGVSEILEIAEHAQPFQNH